MPKYLIKIIELLLGFAPLFLALFVIYLIKDLFLGGINASDGIVAVIIKIEIIACLVPLAGLIISELITMYHSINNKKTHHLFSAMPYVIIFIGLITPSLMLLIAAGNLVNGSLIKKHEILTTLFG